MSKKGLLRDFKFIAAKELQNSRGVPRNLSQSDKFTLLEVAYGYARVAKDFRLWCRERAASRPRYPITDYLRVVDERLGDCEAATPKADLNDPRIRTISAAVYDLTGFAPTRKSVASLLTEYSELDILDATKEYVDTLDDKNFKTGMKAFFMDGGCAVVIYARSQRKGV